MDEANVGDPMNMGVPATPNPYAFVEVGTRKVSRTRAAGEPGMLLFPGRCSMCSAALSRIFRSAAPHVPFIYENDRVAVEIQWPCARDEAEGHLTHYQAIIEQLGESAGVRTQQELNRAVLLNDIAEIHRLSAILLGDESKEQAERFTACRIEAQTLEAALKQEGDTVYIPRYINVAHPVKVSKPIPEDCLDDALSCCTCSCAGFSDPLPTSTSSVRFDVRGDRPSLPNPYVVYGTDRSDEVISTGRTLQVGALSDERARQILYAATLEDQGKLEESDELIRQEGITSDEWELVTRRKAQRQPWRRLPNETRSFLLELSGGERLNNRQMPAQVKKLVQDLADGSMTGEEAKAFIEYEIRGWTYPMQVKKTVMEALRTKLRVPDVGAVPDWVQEFLSQFRNPTDAAKLIQADIVTAENFRQKMPSVEEKLRSILGRAEMVNAVPAQAAWLAAGGARDAPKKFVDLFASDPKEVTRGIQMRLITSKNYLTLNGSFGSWARVVQLQSQLKMGCAGLDPTDPEQVHLFKQRKDGSHSASVEGWVKDFLINGKGPIPPRIAGLVKGTVTKDNYRSLFGTPRGMPTSPASRAQSSKTKRRPGNKESGVQPSRGAKRGGNVRTYADAVEGMERPSQKKRGRPDADDLDPRILDMFQALSRKMDKFIFGEFEQPRGRPSYVPERGGYGRSRDL